MKLFTHMFFFVIILMGGFDVNTKLLKDCLEFSRGNHEAAKDFFSVMADVLTGKQASKNILFKIKHYKILRYFQSELGYDPNDMQSIYIPMNKILSDIDLLGDKCTAYQICLNNLKSLDTLVDELLLIGNFCAVWYEDGVFPGITITSFDKIFSDGKISFEMSKLFDLFNIVTAHITNAGFVICNKSGNITIQFNTLLFDNDKLPMASEIRSNKQMKQWEEIKKYQRLDETVAHVDMIKAKYLELKALLSYVNDVMDDYDISKTGSSQTDLFTEEEVLLLQDIISGCSESVIKEEAGKVRVMLNGKC